MPGIGRTRKPEQVAAGALGRFLPALVLVAALASAGALCQDKPDEGLLGRWVFDKEHVTGGSIRDTVTGKGASIDGKVTLQDNPPALVLDGTTSTVTVSAHARPDGLPTRQMTAEAWVAIDEPLEWGGIAAFIQDNGGFEKGWILGYRASSFCFAVSTAGADDGDGKLTYLTSGTEFKSERWYHVVGTYDGAEMRVYVNGKLENSSREQSGRINYPARAVYQIGAYHDDDEFFRCKGRINEVRIYGRALSAEEVAEHYRSKLAAFPEPLRLSIGPVVRRVSADAVEVSWGTPLAGSSALEFARAGEQPRTFSSDTPKTFHTLSVGDLEPETDCVYVIKSKDLRGNRTTSETFRYYHLSASYPADASAAPCPYPKDELSQVYERAAESIVNTTGIRNGYCLLLNCGEGRLAFELAKRTRLNIVGIDTDEEKLAAARKALDEAGLYGVRVNVHTASPQALPYCDYFANLVVCDRMLASGELPEAQAEICRVLRPCGGFACIGAPAGSAAAKKLERQKLKAWLERAPIKSAKLVDKDGLWAVVRRDALEGAGEWTHLYAEPGNSACSNDRLVRGAMAIQWFGLPGPRPMIDRHHRTVAPLFKNGLLIAPGDNRIMALDAYNGTPLWDASIPGSRIVATPRDAGTMALTDGYLYVTHRDKCYGLYTWDGGLGKVFNAPQLCDGQSRHWGYIAALKDYLLGSGQKPDASYTSIGRAWDYEIQWGDFKCVVTSDYLFCLSRHTGSDVWSYKGGTIINPTVTVGADRVYFLESDSVEAASDEDGQVTLETLWKGKASLVALDANTGREAWRKPLDTANYRHIVYLSYSDGVILLTGSSNRDDRAWYYLCAFEADTGREIWRGDHPNNVGGVGGDHGEQIHHPVIASGIVYAEPMAYDLKTGERVNPLQAEGQWEFPRRGGCGTMSGSASCIFFRDGNPTVYQMGANGGKRKLNQVSRPGCWINIIPAGGMVLVPEASSGCTCGHPIQASFAFVPVPKPDE